MSAFAIENRDELMFIVVDGELRVFSICSPRRITPCIFYGGKNMED